MTRTTLIGSVFVVVTLFAFVPSAISDDPHEADSSAPARHATSPSPSGVTPEGFSTGAVNSHDLTPVPTLGGR
ncbi:MAG: hypothetical protein AB7O24_30820 [Kofleriaceae bacterium]